MTVVERGVTWSKCVFLKSQARGQCHTSRAFKRCLLNLWRSKYVTPHRAVLVALTQISAFWVNLVNSLTQTTCSSSPLRRGDISTGRNGPSWCTRPQLCRTSWLFVRMSWRWWGAAERWPTSWVARKWPTHRAWKLRLILQLSNLGISKNVLRSISSFLNNNLKTNVPSNKELD
jgi:hypothetical protein